MLGYNRKQNPVAPLIPAANVQINPWKLTAQPNQCSPKLLTPLQLQSTKPKFKNNPFLEINCSLQENSKENILIQSVNFSTISIKSPTYSQFFSSVNQETYFKALPKIDKQQAAQAFNFGNYQNCQYQNLNQKQLVEMDRYKQLNHIRQKYSRNPQSHSPNKTNNSPNRHPLYPNINQPNQIRPSVSPPPSPCHSHIIPKQNSPQKYPNESPTPCPIFSHTGNSTPAFHPSLFPNWQPKNKQSNGCDYRQQAEDNVLEAMVPTFFIRMPQNLRVQRMQDRKMFRNKIKEEIDEELNDIYKGKYKITRTDH